VSYSQEKYHLPKENNQMESINKISKHAHWALRIAFGSVFIFHGVQKFTNLSGGAQMMGMPVAVWGLVALAETLGGVLVLLGTFLPDWATRVGGLLVIPVMIGAIAMVHWPQWSFVPTESASMGGMEFQVSMLLLGVFFLLRGKDI
jgi:putative oxidoreductase